MKALIKHQNKLYIEAFMTDT